MIWHDFQLVDTISNFDQFRKFHIDSSSLKNFIFVIEPKNNSTIRDRFHKAQTRDYDNSIPTVLPRIHDTRFIFEQNCGF